MSCQTCNNTEYVLESYTDKVALTEYFFDEQSQIKIKSCIFKNMSDLIYHNDNIDIRVPGIREIRIVSNRMLLFVDEAAQHIVEANVLNKILKVYESKEDPSVFILNVENKIEGSCCETNEQDNDLYPLYDLTFKESIQNGGTVYKCDICMTPTSKTTRRLILTLRDGSYEQLSMNAGSLLNELRAIGPVLKSIEDGETKYVIIQNSLYTIGEISYFGLQIFNSDGKEFILSYSMIYKSLLLFLRSNDLALLVDNTVFTKGNTLIDPGLIRRAKELVYKVKEFMKLDPIVTDLEYIDTSYHTISTSAHLFDVNRNHLIIWQNGLDIDSVSMEQIILKYRDMKIEKESR